MSDRERPHVPRTGLEQDELAALGSMVRTDLSAFWEAWVERGSRLVEREPAAAARIGRELLDVDEPLLACDVLSRPLEHWPEHLLLRQLRALAFAQAGAIEQAAALVSELRTEGHQDEETEGLAARLLKDRALGAADAAERRKRLRIACEAYRRSFEKHHGYWSGINAATLALLADDGATARNLAQEVKSRCLILVGAGEQDPYWPLATLGEACLVLGERGEAESWYAKAAAEGRRRLRDLASTRRNGRLLCDALSIDRGWLDSCLPMPAVVVFCGHMIDKPGRAAAPRFPPACEPVVSERIRENIDRVGATIGYGSAACGADILFHEAMAARGAELRLVLPYQIDRFEQDSVAFAGEAWRRRFRAVLDKAASVLVASEQARVDDALVYQYGNRILLGLALDRAARLETRLVPMAVWDGCPGDGEGGTASNVQLWRSRELEPELIALAAGAGGGTAGPTRAPAPRLPNRRLVALLRADGKGLSRLTDDKYPDFVKKFLGGVAQAVQAVGVTPLSKNTWGDGIDFVFASVVEAGVTALEIADRLAPSALTDEMPAIRIALHVGPVHELHDPVADRPTYFGSHITRAARIEPITPAGQVWASEAFAAFTRVEDRPPFACEYIGRLPLDKGYGVYPLYRVRRKT